MSTGVIVNDYEIRNWHTVSILELARVRQKQAQPGPVEKVQKKKPAKRSKDMKKVEINDDMVRSWVIASRRDQISVASLSRASGVSHYVITRRIAEYLEANPDFAAKLDVVTVKDRPQPELPKVAEPVTKVTAAPPAGDEQMDDPETYAAATDSRVIAAQEMVTFPRLVTAFDDLPLQPRPTRRAYAPPAIIREGSLKPVTVVPEVQTVQVNTLEQLPRLANFLRDLRGIEGIRIAGSVSIALSIEAEL